MFLFFVFLNLEIKVVFLKIKVSNKIDLFDCLIIKIKERDKM